MTSKHQFRSIGAELLNCNDDSATSLHPVKRKHLSDLERISRVFLLHCCVLRCECIIRICVADIQEFYELTLLDDTKSIQQKTAETIRIANKWEASDGPITPTYSNNDVSYFTYQHAKGSVLSPNKEASTELLPSVSLISCQCVHHGKSFPKNMAIQALMHGVPNAYFFASKVLSKFKGLS